jgi:parallel beta-helix repeat protein
MKRLALLVGLAALGFSGREPLEAQQIPVRIGGSPSSFVGVPFDLPIEIDLSARGEKLGSFALTLRWNPAVLHLLGGKDGNFGAVTTYDDSIPRGVIKFAGANPGGVGGKVVIGVGRFVPLAAASDTLRLSVSELYAAQTFADLLPSAVWSDRAYCPAVGRYGDIDGDQAANSRDALLALAYSVGMTVPGNPAMGDVDGDGVTGARDALIVLSSAVGLDVSGFRVLLVAPGACATPRRPLLALVPGGVTFDLGQRVRYAAVASDSTGAGIAVTDVYWSSSDDRVATVSPDGVVTAVAPGTATITARRQSGAAASATVTVLQRHTHWVDAFASPDRGNQIGAPELPFASLQDGLNYARPGDTVRVRLGRYEGPVVIARRLVVIGDTGLAGERPRIEFGGGPQGAGIELVTESSVVLHNLAIEGFETGIGAGTLDTLEVEGLRIRLAQGGCGWAGIGASQARALMVRRSRLVGDGQWTGCADGISVNYGVGLLLVEDALVTDFGSNGIAAYLADSTVVRRSTIADNYYMGVFLSSYGFGGEAPRRAAGAGATTVPTSAAWVVEQSKLLRNYYGGIHAEQVRSGYLGHSLIDMADYDNAIEVSGNAGAGYVTLVADSLVRTAGYNWIEAFGLDSVVVDSTRVTRTYGGNFYNVGLVRVTRSSILDIDYGKGIAVSYGYGGTGGRLVVDSVTVRGSAQCPRCADGIDAYQTGVNVNRLLAENLDDGIFVNSDSGATITNSAVRNVWYGVRAYSYVSARLMVKKSDFVGAYGGVLSGNMVTVVDSSALTAGVGDYEGIYTWGGGADTVRYNTVAGYRYGIDVEDSLAYVGNNTVLQPVYAAIYASRSSSVPADTSVFLNNAVTCDARGATSARGFDVYQITHRIEGNTVTGCSQGIWLSSSGNVDVSIVRNNTITVPEVASSAGISANGYRRAEVVGNSVAGALSAGGYISVSGDFYVRARFARIDSNIVRGAQAFGIRLAYVDSGLVRGNLVEDVTVPSCCPTNPGGIALSNSAYLARIERNTLRRMRGAGIAIAQGSDTATVVVDSNAVSAADTAAVRLTTGKLLMRGNNVRNNPRYGVQITSSLGAIHQIHGNAFQGNGLYAVLSPSDSVDATGNWWGVDGALPGTAGADSVSGRVNGTSPLAGEPAGLLPLAPPVVAAAPQATAVRLPAISVPAAQAGFQAERPIRASRPARAPKTGKALPLDRAGDLRAARLARAIEWEKQREAQRASMDSSLAALDGAWRAAEERRQEARVRREREWRKQ